MNLVPKLYFFHAQLMLSMKFILHIDVRMPTIFVGLLTFISRINTASGSFNARKIVILQHFSFASRCNNNNNNKLKQNGFITNYTFLFSIFPCLCLVSWSNFVTFVSDGFSQCHECACVQNHSVVRRARTSSQKQFLRTNNI